MCAAPPRLTALLAPVAEYIAELITELSDQKVYLDGASKLLRFPEYRDTKKAQTLLDYMEDDRKHLLPATRKIDGIQFFIGPENGENPLSETSAIYAKYDIGKIGQGCDRHRGSDPHGLRQAVRTAQPLRKRAEQADCRDIFR